MANEFTYNVAITVAQDAELETFVGKLPSFNQTRIAVAAGLADQATPFDVANNAEYAAFAVAARIEVARNRKLKK